MLRADNDEFPQGTLKPGSSEGLVKHGTSVASHRARQPCHRPMYDSCPSFTRFVGLRGGSPALQALHSGWLGWIAPWGWAALLSSDEDSSGAHEHPNMGSHQRNEETRGHRSDARHEHTNRAVGARAAAGAPAADPFNAFNQPANQRFPLLSKFGAPSHLYRIPPSAHALTELPGRVNRVTFAPLPILRSLQDGTSRSTRRRESWIQWWVVRWRWYARHHFDDAACRLGSVHTKGTHRHIDLVGTHI
jgi:hypothetical protein